jgi:alkanesulfonate monooxygenase SsuD/methylene tetrahydromethanopterin reductase-like flavin-dependent oxidoreductase (luciferase family)
MDMERGEIAKLGVRPRPYQQPHPPLWMVLSAAPQALRWAAAHNVKGMFWMPTVKELKRRFETYREIASEVCGTPVPLGADLAVMRDCYVAETMEEARRDFEEAILTSYRWITHWRGLSNLMDPGEELQPGTELTYDLLHERNLLVGTPDYVAEKIGELQSELNLQYLLVWTMHPGMPHEKLLRSLRLFGTEVLPRVRGARHEVAAVR